METLKKQRERIEAEIKEFESMGGSFKGRFENIRDNAFARYPIVFVLLTSFGLVATFYGFEKVIESISFFSEHPMYILITGIFTLGLSGTLYKKLS